MREHSDSCLSERLFALLLYLFPREFRGDFAEQMLDDFRDQRQDVYRGGSRFGTVRLCASTFVGVLRQALREHFDMLGRDVQYAFRLLRRSPGFTAVAVLTLGLGIGTNTAIFALADGMLFRPLPFRDPDRLVLLQAFDARQGRSTTVYNRVYRIDFEQLKAHHSGLAGIAMVASGGPLSWIATDGAESISTSIGTPNLLEVLSVTPHIGRALKSGDEVVEPRPAMLTYEAWRHRFGADPAILGRILRFDQRSVQIVGVQSQDFIYPVQGSIVSGELLMVEARAAEDAANPRAGVWTPVARLNAGVSIEEAQSEVDVLVRRAAQQFPETTQLRALRVANLQFALFELSRPLLWLLIGGAGCVLLIACVNLAALLVARSAVREHELGIRMAIGASRGRIVQQLIIEAFLIGGLGGVAALFIGWFTYGLLVVEIPDAYRLVPESLTGRAMAFTAIVSIGASLLFSVLPALLGSRGDGNVSIRIRRQPGIAGWSLMKAGGTLVGLEVALGLILFAGTGLTVNSLIRMRTVDLGFEPSGVVALRVGLPRNRDATASAQYDYFAHALRSVRHLSTVQVAAGVNYPQAGGTAPPRLLPDAGPAGIGLWTVTPRYFDTMAMPLLAGRDFTEADVRDNAAVAIVSETAARTMWPDRYPISRVLDVDGEPHTVIGLVKDVRPGFGRAVNASVYRPLSRHRFRSMAILARGSGDPAALAIAMRTAAQRLDPTVVIPFPQQLEGILSRGIAKSRFETMLFSIFGLLGLLVAAIGLYGLMAVWVGTRTREMGVRLALGANSVQIRSLVLRQAAVPLLGGVAGGLFGAFALAGRLTSLLYGITPHDPGTFGAVVAVLLGTGLAAAYVPARRAARVDPLMTLRAE